MNYLIITIRRADFGWKSTASGRRAGGLLNSVVFIECLFARRSSVLSIKIIKFSCNENRRDAHFVESKLRAGSYFLLNVNQIELYLRSPRIKPKSIRNGTRWEFRAEKPTCPRGPRVEKITTVSAPGVCNSGSNYLRNEFKRTRTHAVHPSTLRNKTRRIKERVCRLNEYVAGEAQFFARTSPSRRNDASPKTRNVD